MLFGMATARTCVPKLCPGCSCLRAYSHACRQPNKQETHMLGSFFDYPDQGGGEQSQELVFLPQWDDATWATLLTYTELRRFQAGDAVIRQGDTDRAFYIIIDGKLEVLIPRGASGKLRRTQTREAGAVIGEQAFLDGKPRSATLRAI